MKKFYLKETSVVLATIIYLVVLWSLMLYVNKNHDPFFYSIMTIYTLISFIRIVILFQNKKKISQMNLLYQKILNQIHISKHMKLFMKKVKNY